MDRATFADIEWAAGVIGLPPTPAWSYPTLDAAVGASVIVKHENVQPTGAFKVRGGLALLASMTAEEIGGGLICASTGNMAQGLAYACRAAGVPAVVVAPTTTAPVKITAVRGLGAEVVVEGPTMVEAIAHAHRLADERGMTFVTSGQPAIIAGHGTVYLELLREHPDLEAIYVPVGSGSGAAGACLVRDELAPNCRIVAVQSSSAPAGFRSWQGRTIVSAPCETRIGGLATGSGYEHPQPILWDRWTTSCWWTASRSSRPPRCWPRRRTLSPREPGPPRWLARWPTPTVRDASE